MGQETPVNIPRFVKQHIYFSLHLTNQYACHWSDAAVVLLLEWPIQSFRFECACVADIMPLLFQQPKIKGTYNLRRRGQTFNYLLFHISNDNMAHCWRNPANTPETNQFGTTPRGKTKALCNRQTVDKKKKLCISFSSFWLDISALKPKKKKKKKFRPMRILWGRRSVWWCVRACEGVMEGL